MFKTLKSGFLKNHIVTKGTFVYAEQWKALGPERRKRICENLMKRAEARIKAKESGKLRRSP